MAHCYHSSTDPRTRPSWAELRRCRSSLARRARSSAPCRRATATAVRRAACASAGAAGAGEQGPAPEPVELGLVHALAAAPDAGQRVVQQAECLLGPSGQQLGLREQPQPPGDQVLRATRLDVLQALAQQP